MKRLNCYRTIVISVSFLLWVSAANAAIWQNETNSSLECDYCVLQYPSSVTNTAGSTTGLIYGRIYENGFTEPPGANPLIVAEIGYGPVDTDPRTSGAWQWLPATYNDDQTGPNDEYKATLLSPFGGVYSYTFRFSLDNGISFTAADLNGAGSNADLDFEYLRLGILTVDGAPAPVPIPGAAWLLGTGLVGLAAIRRMLK